MFRLCIKKTKILKRKKEKRTKGTQKKRKK